MILVDTSVWLDFFTHPNSATTLLLEKIIKKESLCINGLINMEILQGARNEKDYLKLKDYLAPFIYYKEISGKSLDLATEIYRNCRSRGITIRKSIDCLIAADSLIYNLRIFHKDRDFDLMAKVFKNLSVFSASF